MRSSTSATVQKNVFIASIIRFDSSLPSRLTQPNRVSSATRPTAVKLPNEKQKTKWIRDCNFRNSACGYLSLTFQCPFIQFAQKMARQFIVLVSHLVHSAKWRISNGKSVRLLYLAVAHEHTGSLPLLTMCLGECVSDVAVNYLSIKSLAISLSGTIYLRAVDGCSITCWTCARKLSHFSPWLRSRSVYEQQWQQRRWLCVWAQV